MAIISHTPPTPHPIFYASITTRTGATMQLGDVIYFFPAESSCVHVVQDPNVLLVIGEVPEPFATYLRAECAARLGETGGGR